MNNHQPHCEDVTGAYPGSCTCVRTNAVTQADREAAAKGAVLAEFRELIRSGRMDHHADPWMEHRLTERAAIVAWLPKQPPHLSLQEYADAIERGAHLLAPPSCPRCGHATDSEIHQWCEQKEPSE